MVRTEQEVGPAMAHVVVNWPVYGARVRAAWSRLRRLPARPHGLRTQLAAMVVIALLPAGLAQGLAALQVARHLTGLRLHTMAGLADGAAAGVDRDLSLAAAIAGSFAESDAGPEDSPFPELQHRILTAVGAMHVSALLWRVDGVPVPGELLTRFAGLSDPESAERARDAVSPNAQRETRTAAGARRFDRFVPLRHDGAVTAVLEVAVPSERIAETLAEPLRREQASAILVDGSGHILAHAEQPDPIVAATLPAWLWRETQARQSGTLDGGDFGRDTLVAAFAAPPSAPTWRVVVVASPDEIPAVLWWPLGAISVATLSSVILGTSIALWFGARIVRPLKQLTMAAQAVAAGSDTLADVPNSLVREFNDLRNGVARADAVLRRRAAAERLALQEARTGHELLASVVNGTPDLIYVKDLEQRFVLVNQAALRAEVIGREEWQVLGRTAHEISPGQFAERSEQLGREVIATGEVRRARFQWSRPDGTTASYTITKSPWANLDGRIAGVVTVAHDFTDQLAAEQRVAAVQGELLRATRLSAMGAMASGLAHELNQPLAAATNFLNATARMLARDDPATVDLPLVRKAVGDAVEQTLRAGQIVRRLRGFIGRGETDMRIENVGDIIREIMRVACVDGAIDERLMIIIPGDDGVHVLVERTQIQQVLLNLIKNASEAIDGAPGGRVELAWRAIPGGVEITVTDNGPGISPEIRNRLFQPFASTKANGMGIGLAICRTIIEGHGGTLVAEDRGAAGVLFRITLPPVTSANPNETEMGTT